MKTNNIFLVGGCVRDVLLWFTTDPKDVDFTMAGDPKNIYNNFDKTNLSHFMTEKFGTITLIPKKQKSDEKLQYELTPLREEDNYTDNRHPEEISWSNSIISDAKRRDFTINCMYYFCWESKIKQKNTKKEQSGNKYNIDWKFLEKNGYFFIVDMNLCILQDHNLIEWIFKKGNFDKIKFTELIKKWNSSIKKMKSNHIEIDETDTLAQIVVDPYLGLQSLTNGKLSCVGTPDKRFQEDALRIIRALRIPNIINEKLLKQKTNEKSQFLDYETKTWASLKKNFFLVQFIAKERIKDEVVKVFSKWNPFGFVSLLDEVNLLKLIFPALYETKNVDQPVRYHPFDVYTHTMLSLFELQKINSDYLTRLGMLYHDVGKVDQYYSYKLQLTQEEVRELFGTRLNHQKWGIDIARKDLENLKFSKKEIDIICWYIGAHHKPGEILDAKPNNRTKKMRKLLSEAWYEKVKNVIDICIGDRRGQYNPMQNNWDISDVFELKNILNKLEKEEWQFTMKKLMINGNDIMKKFNIKAGPELGNLLKKAFDRVINDIGKRNKKTMIYKYLEKTLSK